MSDFRPQEVSFRIFGVLILLVSFIFVVVCIVGMVENEGSLLWGVATVISIVGAILVCTCYVLIKILMLIESEIESQVEILSRLLKHSDQVVRQLEKLNESILLSEGAKAIAFREKDFNVLKQAIDEEIAKRNWESAEYLISQMENRFGYRSQAHQLREKMRQIQREQFEQEISNERQKFEKFLAEYDWDNAVKELNAIREKFPEAENEIKKLEEKLEAAKTARKKQLLNLWDDAVKKNEVDRGIEILKELDKYLTPNEVAALEESARGVFRAKLHNLGMQFSLFVTEKLWDKAYDVGMEIIKEFPNSRMAQEIRERLDVLKEKAQAMKSKLQQGNHT